MTLDFDVVVVDGGAAGLAAAVGAARAGARACLVEAHGHLGGAAVASSVLTYCGFFDRAHRQVVAGVGQEFLEALAARDRLATQTSAQSGNRVVLLDLETTKLVFDAVAAEAGVTVFLHSTVFAADAVHGRVTAVEFAHRGGRVRVTGRAFVDCSGDGMLLAAAGARVAVSPVAERQASTLVMRVGGVAENADLSRDGVAAAVRAHRSRCPVPLVREHGPAVRLPVSGEVMLLIADDHRDVLDVAESSAAEAAARELAHHYLEALRRGLRGWERGVLTATGPSIGVRESRRMAGVDVVTGADVVTARKRPDDVVARGGWYLEDHRVPGVTVHTAIAGDGWYDIPFGAVRSASHGNLWAAGRLLSTDPVAFTSTRVMGTAFATGHACGTGAALQAADGAVDAAGLQRVLRSQGALL